MSDRTIETPAPADGPPSMGATPGASAGTVRALIVDADAALFGLLEEWLSEAGCKLAQARTGGLGAQERYDFVIVDVPFPRQATGSDAVRRVAREHPRTPIVVLSSSFFAGIEPSGAVARNLGAEAVLPKPVTREALLAAVRQVVRIAR